MATLDSEYLMAAGFLFERARGVSLSSFETDVIADAGLESASVDEVAAGIWNGLKEDMPADWRCSAYWALGKRYCRDDRDGFVAALRVEVSRNASVVYQIMVALDNLREPVFSPERSSRSATEEALNLADAAKYLAKWI